MKPLHRGKPRSRQGGTGGRTAAIFLVPFFALFLFTMIAPLIYSVILSLFATKKSGLGFGASPETIFVGLENFVEVLSSQSFLAGFGRLAIYIVLYIPAMIGGALILALLLDSTAALLKRTFQLLLFLPHAVPGVIAALIWTYLYTPGVSPIVRALESGGISIDFFSAELVLPAIVNIAVWEWTGFNVIIIYTALQAVPREVLEAARVDGAGGVRTAIAIKLPLVAPALGVILLFTSIGSLQLFTQPAILSTASSAITPTYVPNMWAYDAAFNRLDLNQAAAASIIIAALAGVVSFFITRLNSKGATA
ncbi:carbohydrate ABC transporter permease [Microbacterium sulfonylureivorans]|uniref:carbohydrate ABC transporter permease n=1 Tax=Microbacterium sulfonylureivorans TaxID=2486854 RepID=UPI000FDA7FF4|nr:sugar ABC transporter permease [Microbacterium sulfonylureivorans]